MSLSKKALNDSAAQRIAPLKVLQDKETLLINETYLSIQGEGSHVGLPCFFIRLTGCHLRCTYCDSEHSFYKGQEQTVASLVKEAIESGARHVQVTGGEPLLQKYVYQLISDLADHELTVLLETSGSVSLKKVDKRAHIIMDVKPRSSGEYERNRWACFDELKSTDEVKFIIETQSDFRDALKIIETHQLEKRFQLLFSPSHLQLTPEKLVQWVLAAGVQARVQLQLHKYIWGEKTGV